MAKIYLSFLLFIVFTFSLKSQKADIPDLYTKLDPSVVLIEIISSQTEGTGEMYKKVKVGSLGSGVLISDDGKIITAAHVVNDADAIRVSFKDGQQLRAKVVGLSHLADVAMIQCQGVIKNPHPAKLGDSDKMRVGDQVIVIGAPMGLSHSLSVGYISRKEQMKDKRSGFVRLEYFQTDAAINTGNSGGPMFNMQGEVVGIVSSILSRSGGFEGIGFAATINIVKDLLMNKRNTWLGIDAFILEGPLALALNVPQEAGVLIQNVTENSPAYFMGLKGGYFKAIISERPLILGGDIILGIDDIKFVDEDSILKGVDYLNELTPGTKYTLKILRNGKIQNINWVIKE